MNVFWKLQSVYRKIYEEFDSLVKHKEHDWGVREESVSEAPSQVSRHLVDHVRVSQHLLC